MSLIQCIGLTKHYSNGGGAVKAVQDVCLDIGQGAFVAITGESGSGKSTLLSMLGGLLRPTDGRLMVDGIDIYGLKGEKLADFRREYVGFVFQSFHLVPYLSVMENVMLPLAVAPVSERDKKGLALQALERVGLADHARRLPGQLSGGEQERVAIARAVVNEPPILLADEPTGNLDSRNSRQVMELLQSLQDEGVTIIMVTHSAANSRYAQRLLVMKDGKMGEPEG